MTNDEQEHYLSALLQCQLNLARSVSTDSHFSSNLQKVIVLSQLANNISFVSLIADHSNSYTVNALPILVVKLSLPVVEAGCSSADLLRHI